MPIPEYVFLSRVREFYDNLRAGHNLWKIDETLHFIDDRGRSMIKRWIQDDRYQWTIGRGYTILAQPAPLITLIVQSDSDRPGGYFVGNYVGEGIAYEPDGATPQEYWQSSGRLKSGSFLFIVTAPNVDLLNAMYALLERALYEGESPPINEPNIISFNDYGIGEISYRGADVRPDQSYLPINTFARTLSISCTYSNIWSGKIFGKSDYVFSIDIGNVVAYDDEVIQTNPILVGGIPALPLSSPSSPSTSGGGITFTTSTVNTETPSVFTTDGGPQRPDNVFLVPPFTSLMFDAIVGANQQGAAAAFWKFSGIVRRENAESTTRLVGLTTPQVVADPIFADTYIDIHADTANGALIISAKGLNDEAITWKASIVAKELP